MIKISSYFTVTVIYIRYTVNTIGTLTIKYKQDGKLGL